VDLLVTEPSIPWVNTANLVNYLAWNGRLSIDESIHISKEHWERGEFITHREHGTLVDLNPAKKRAIGKVKATISQRFNIQECAIDVECDCRLIFFCVKLASEVTGHSEWKVQYMKVIYEKDKIIPADGYSVPTFDGIEPRMYPEGYRYFGMAQNILGHKIRDKLPTLNGHGYFETYEAIGLWLQGDDVIQTLGLKEGVAKM
jgi:hypothetical protein